MTVGHRVTAHAVRGASADFSLMPASGLIYPKRAPLRLICHGHKASSRSTETERRWLPVTTGTCRRSVSRILNAIILTRFWRECMDFLTGRGTRNYICAHASYCSRRTTAFDSRPLFTRVLLTSPPSMTPPSASRTTPPGVYLSQTVDFSGQSLLLLVTSHHDDSTSTQPQRT